MALLPIIVANRRKRLHKPAPLTKEEREALFWGALAALLIVVMIVSAILIVKLT